jgi:hypothetical protein
MFILSNHSYLFLIPKPRAKMSSKQKVNAVLYYGPLAFELYHLNRIEAGVKRIGKPFPKLGYVNNVNANCWLDHPLMILLVANNKEFDPSRWKPEGPEDTKLAKAMMELKGKLEKGEKGELCGEIKNLLGPEFPKKSEYYDSFSLLGHVIKRLGLGNYDQLHITTNTFETDVMRIMRKVDLNDPDKDLLSVLKTGKVGLVKRLYAFVILHNMHYTAYFIRDGIWIYYNDIKGYFDFFNNEEEMYNSVKVLHSPYWESIDAYYTYPSNLKGPEVIEFGGDEPNFFGM